MLRLKSSIAHTISFMVKTLSDSVNTNKKSRSLFKKKRKKKSSMDPDRTSYVRLNEDKVIPKSDVLSLLKTYNCYHEGKSFQLRIRQSRGSFVPQCTSLLELCVVPSKPKETRRGALDALRETASFPSGLRLRLLETLHGPQPGWANAFIELMYSSRDCERSSWHSDIVGRGAKVSSSLLGFILEKDCCVSLGFDLEEGELMVEGLLNISWGLRRAIRLQMHDDNERFRLACPCAWRSENPHTCRPENAKPQLYSELNNNKISISTLTSLDATEEDIPQLLRTRSDASFVNIQRRPKLHSTSDSLRIRRHRFSINGHFYNHKTSVFTPSYGSVTNVRVNSNLTTKQILNLLLNKFRVENKADEFGLYLVHESGERTKLKDTEFPLVSRLLHGPCEQIARIFIMEEDLGEEITYDVAQYIKFEMPVLDSFIKKLKEEEEREILKLTEKYNALKSMILQKLDGISNTTGSV
ncbi:hypothetical protein DNTS_020267 [Danionella cerebrum]|uniref:Ras-associating domain-containing protein n=1 Tax=Danionella cerebrum TaxID=2873325 RepID=A0A553MKK4_9TELE|nr:hypothetical protein DNTS_020267 [Danionella translucida]